MVVLLLLPETCGLLDVQKKPPTKIGGVGPTNWEETARMEIQNEYYNGISYFGCVVPLIAHS